MSFGIIVTCFACIAHKLVSSNSVTRNPSAASCSASTVAGVRCKSNVGLVKSPSQGAGREVCELTVLSTSGTSGFLLVPLSQV